MNAMKLAICLFMLSLGSNCVYSSAQQVNHYRFAQVLPSAPSGWYFDQLAAISNAPDGTFWLGDTNGRLQHINTDKSLIAEFNLAAEFGTFIDEIAAAPDGSIWILVYKRKLIHYSAKGVLLKSFEFPVPGANADSAMVMVRHLVVAPDGSLWVTLFYQHAYENLHRGAYHLSTNGKLLGEISCVADGEDPLKRCSPEVGRLYDPNGIAMAKDGSLWISDKESHRLLHYTAEGRLLAAVGQRGAGNDAFNYPDNILIAKNNSLWVVDALNSRLLHLDQDGRFIASGLLNSPMVYLTTNDFSLAEMPDASVLLNQSHTVCCDAPHTILRQFSPEGRLLSRIGPSDSNGELLAPSLKILETER